MFSLYRAKQFLVFILHFLNICQVFKCQECCFVSFSVSSYTTCVGLFHYFSWNRSRSLRPTGRGWSPKETWPTSRRNSPTSRSGSPPTTRTYFLSVRVSFSSCIIGSQKQNTCHSVCTAKVDRQHIWHVTGVQSPSFQGEGVTTYKMVLGGGLYLLRK